MEEIIIYGAGNMGRAVFDLLHARCRILGFLDANQSLRGATLYGIPIYHPSDISQKQELFHAVVLVAMTACPFSAMKKTLSDLGFAHIAPAGDYVAEIYRPQFILNTWIGAPFGEIPDFSDKKSCENYYAACRWFEGREDEAFDRTGSKYFPDFLHRSLEQCRTMLDTAALDGGYIDTFIAQDPSRKVYAYTLTPCSVPLAELTSKYPEESVKLFPYETSDFDRTTECRRIGLMQPFTNSDLYQIHTQKIDTVSYSYDYLRCYSMSPVLPILKGAANSIQENRPVIAVNIGHFQSDFFETPDYLKSICTNYRFYFRVHSYQGNDCILYAVPKEKQVV